MKAGASQCATGSGVVLVEAAREEAERREGRQDDRQWGRMDGYQ